ncbi:MAG: hypothetical protein C4326_13030 [Ignavibacteria bacterium]
MYALAGFSRPSLSNKYSAQYDNLYHSFQYNGDVWMGPVWLPEAASRDDPSLVNNRNSSVAVDATGRAHVVWIAYDKSRDIDVVVHRSRYNNEWSSYSIFIDDVGRAINLQASVCAHHDASTGGVSMFWSDGDVPFVFDQLAVEGYTFNNWKYTAFGAVANDPNAAALAPPTGSTFATTLATRGLSSIAVAYQNDADDGSSPVSQSRTRASKLYRRAYFRDSLSQALLSMEFGDIVVLAGRDTLNKQLHFAETRTGLRSSFLRTASFRLPQPARLLLRLWATADRLPVPATVSLVVVDSATGTVVRTLTSVSLNRAR